MFGVGAVWAALIGALVAAVGDANGFQVAFLLMAASYGVAILPVLGMRAGSRPA